MRKSEEEVAVGKGKLRMSVLFPNDIVINEVCAGLVKSIICVKNNFVNENK